MSEAQQQLNGQHITLHLNLIKVSSSQVFHPSILNFPFLPMSVLTTRYSTLVLLLLSSRSPIKKAVRINTAFLD